MLLYLISTLALPYQEIYFYMPQLGTSLRWSNEFRGHIRICHSMMTKTCWGNIGSLFVICMQQVTKGHLM